MHQKSLETPAAIVHQRSLKTPAATVHERSLDAKTSYDHINSPVRDLLRQQQQQEEEEEEHLLQQEQQLLRREKQLLQKEQQLLRNSKALRDKYHQSASGDSVDRFVQNFQSNSNNRHSAYLNPPTPDQSLHGAHSAYSSFAHGAPPNIPRYVEPVKDSSNMSIVSESRLLPANPWSSSDMLSSLVPLGASAHAKASRGVQRPDMEKSLASNSLLMYLGHRTPAEGAKVR